MVLTRNALKYTAVCAALWLLAPVGARGQADPDWRWGRIANPGFQNLPIRSTLFFTGSAKDGTTPYGYSAPVNTHLYTAHPTDAAQLTWSQSQASRDLALNQMVAAGVNVVTMSSWGEDFLAPQDSWGRWAPMQCAPQSHDELFAAAAGKSLLITPLIESRANWTFRAEFPANGFSIAPGTVSQIENLVRRYLQNPAHPEWADRWTKVYNRHGEPRYAVTILHASSDRLSPGDHAAYAAGFDAIAEKVLVDTGVKVGFFLDALPRNSPSAPGAFRPTPAETGPELAARSSILGLANFIPEIWADVPNETQRIAWKRDFSAAWAATGIPFLMDVSPGYDAHLVFPGSVQYGHNETWRTALSQMVRDFGQDGLVYNSWNGYTEAMTAVATQEYGDAYREWLRAMTHADVPGDANSDGRVDAQDAAILAAYWGQTGATWAMGDFNADGTVAAEDAAILAANWNAATAQTTPSTAAEPSSCLLLAAVAAMVASLRRPSKTEPRPLSEPRP